MHGPETPHLGVRWNRRQASSPEKTSLPAGATTTRFLESLPFSPHAIEVVSPGMNTTVQACHSTISDLRHCTVVPMFLLRCCASQHTVKLESISCTITGRVPVILKVNFLVSVCAAWDAGSFQPSWLPRHAFPIHQTAYPKPEIQQQG